MRNNPFEAKVLQLVDPRPSSPPEAYMTDGELEEGVAAAVVTEVRDNMMGLRDEISSLYEPSIEAHVGRLRDLNTAAAIMVGKKLEEVGTFLGGMQCGLDELIDMLKVDEEG